MGVGLVVLDATSGMNLPLKVGPMLSLAGIAVVTKIDRVSQAERDVFRARIQDVAPAVTIREVNALYGFGIEPLVERTGQTRVITFDAQTAPATLCRFGWKDSGSVDFSPPPRLKEIPLRGH